MKRALLAACVCTSFLIAQAPVNDDPAGAIAVFDGINPSAPAGVSGSFFTTVGATNSVGYGQDGCGSSTFGPDVFFIYTANATGPVGISTCTPPGFAIGTHTDTTLSVFDVANPTTSIACDDDDCNALPGFASYVTASLTAGTSYYIRIRNWQTTTASGTFYLTINAAAPTHGDTCLTAGAIAAGPNQVSTFGATATNPNTPGCTSFTTSNLDVWYTYTAAASGTASIFREGVGFSQHAVYTTPDCTTFTAVGTTCGTTNPFSFLTASGTTYYIRVGRTSATTTDFGGATLFFSPPIPPANDECGNASLAVVGDNAGSTLNGSPSNSPVGNCSQFGSIPDTWHVFSAPSAGDYAFAVSGTGANTLGVFDAEDCVTGFDFACASPSIVTLVDTQLVFVRVGHTSGTQGPYTLTISGPLSSNRTLATALPVSLGVNPQPFAGFDGDMYANFDIDPLDSNGGAIPNPNCGSGHNSDVFFSFVSPCTGTITVETCPVPGFTQHGTHLDTVLQVLDGTASTQLACNDDVCAPGFGGSAFLSFTSFTATAGQLYIFRVMSWSGAADGTFYLTVKAPAELVTVGTGCGSGPLPTLVGSGPPAFGSTGTITVTAQPIASGALLAAPPNYANAYFPFGPCTVYLSQPGLVLLLPIATDGAGQWSLSATFPPFDPALVCQGLDLQALLFGAGGMEMTNALRLIFGM